MEARPPLEEEERSLQLRSPGRPPCCGAGVGEGRIGGHGEAGEGRKVRVPVPAPQGAAAGASLPEARSRETSGGKHRGDLLAQVLPLLPMGNFRARE